MRGGPTSIFRLKRSGKSGLKMRFLSSFCDFVRSKPLIREGGVFWGVFWGGLFWGLGASEAYVEKTSMIHAQFIILRQDIRRLLNEVYYTTPG